MKKTNLDIVWYEPSRRRDLDNIAADIKKEAIKVKLLIEIKRALQEQGEQNIYTNMWAIEPIMDKFFEDHLIQSKAKIWD